MTSGSPATGYWAPGAAGPLDTHGNIPGGVITRILSAAKASSDPMQNETARSKKRRVGRSQYVPIKSGGKLAPGVYVREGRSLRPVLRFVAQPSYSKRFAFYEVGERTIRETLPKHFRAALRQAVATAKKR